MTKIIKSYDEYLSEDVYQYKRQYTEIFPEKKIYTGAKLRNAILNAIGDGVVTEDEMSEIIKQAGASDTWFINNK